MEKLLALIHEFFSAVRTFLTSAYTTIASYLPSLKQQPQHEIVAADEEGWNLVERVDQQQLAIPDGDPNFAMRQLTAIKQSLAKIGLSVPGIGEINKFVDNLRTDNQRLAEAVTEETIKEFKRTSEMLKAFPPLFNEFHAASATLTTQLHRHPAPTEEKYQEMEQIAASLTNSLLALRKFGIELDVQLSSCSLMNTDIMKFRVHKHLDGCTRAEDVLKAIKKKLQARLSASAHVNAFEEVCKELAALHQEILGYNADDSQGRVGQPDYCEETAPFHRIQEL